MDELRTTHRRLMARAFRLIECEEAARLRSQACKTLAGQSYWHARRCVYHNLASKAIHEATNHMHLLNGVQR
jgi:hypothetical protein